MDDKYGVMVKSGTRGREKIECKEGLQKYEDFQS
jgi:hypothetical protein